MRAVCGITPSDQVSGVSSNHGCARYVLYFLTRASTEEDHSRASLPTIKGSKMASNSLRNSELRTAADGARDGDTSMWGRAHDGSMSTSETESNIERKKGETKIPDGEGIDPQASAIEGRARSLPRRLVTSVRSNAMAKLPFAAWTRATPELIVVGMQQKTRKPTCRRRYHLSLSLARSWIIARD